jgi:hypothetical protein
MPSSIHPIVRFPPAQPIIPGHPSLWLPSHQRIDTPTTKVGETPNPARIVTGKEYENQDPDRL